MTYNDTYQNHKDCGIDRNLAKYNENHSKPKEILLECGEGTGSRTFTSSDESPFQLVFLNLDTTTLDKSKVLIKFSSIVNVQRLINGATVRLKYELFKRCEDGKTKPLGNWMLDEIDIDLDEFEVQQESFSFIFCDCSTCPQRCDYLVVVTPLEIDGATATVSNGRIAALAQTICDSLEKEDKSLELRHYDSRYTGSLPKARDILLTCGEGNGSVILREESEIEPPFAIAHVTVDTTLINNPKVLIEFSSIIKLDEDVTDIRLQFELFRSCGDGEAVSRGSWLFERTGAINDQDLEKVFDFIFCECDAPRGCCEYFVMVTPLEIDIGEEESDIILGNARIVTLAQSSRDLDDCKALNGKSDSSDCELKHSLAKNIILECGNVGGSRTFRSSSESPFQMAEVTIDTTALNNPKVNIEFSSIVSFDKLLSDWDARLRYELIRVCDNRVARSLGVWVIERVRGTARGVTGKSTDIFKFTFCDCISCSDCCQYFVIVTPIQITEGSITATVSNGRIAALAQEGYCGHSNNYYQNHISCTKCKIQAIKMKKILLECGEGTGSRAFRLSNESSFQLAYVTLSVACGNKAEVLIKFSSIVDIVNLATFDENGTAQMKYELFRVQDDKEAISLGTWIFEETDLSSGAFSKQEESFSFIFCDSLVKAGVYDYFVTVIPMEIERAIVTVSNGRMAALSDHICNLIEGEYKISNSDYGAHRTKQKYSKDQDILLACGRGNGSVVFRSDTVEDPPVEIAHLTLDTTSITKPKVLIEFSSMIKFDDGADTIRLRFELFRVCGDANPILLGTWNFERSDINELIELNKAFDFIFYECEVPSGCCEYFVTVTPLETVIQLFGADIVLDNARIVALAQSTVEYNNCKALDRKRDSGDSTSRNSTSKEIVFECGEGSGSRTFRSTNEPAFQIAYVAIDTRPLCNPIVNIEFSSIVSYDRFMGSADGRLRYELFRACDNKEPISVGIWVSERIGVSAFLRTTNIFNFTFCDCVTCSDCCDYFVTVTPIRISEGEITVTVSNGRIAALAQGR